MWEDSTGNKETQNERLCMKSIKPCRCNWQFAMVCSTATETGSSAVGLVPSKCVSGMCQMMVRGVQRSPRPSRCSNWQNINHLQKQMMKVLILRVWAAFQPRLTAETRSCFPSVNITNPETLISSHNLSSSPLNYQCQGPRTQKKYPALRRL